MRSFTPVAALIGTLVLAGGAQAAPITFIGSDAGATSLATMPSSVAASTAFNAAASLLGPVSLIDFEAVALQDIESTAIGLGVSLEDSDAFGTDRIRAGVGDCGFALCGGNTTVAGSHYAEAFGGDLTFSFTTPVEAFGAYFSGLQVASQTITYANGGTQTVNIPDQASGGAFVGFTDAGASIISITIHSLNDIVGIDDVRFVNTTDVPEPVSMLLLGAGVAGVAARRYRRRNAA